MSNGPDPSSQGGEFKANGGPKRRTPGQLSAEDLITLNEEIAAMAKAGLPLDQGLTALAREMGSGKLQQVTTQLADDLRAGFTLPDALQRQEGRVPPYYAALLEAGIRSGRLGEVLGTLTLYARSIAEFRDMTLSALLYPAIVLIIGLGLLIFAGMVVLPKFIEVFESFKMKLPLVTEILVYVGRHAVLILVVPPAVLLVGLLAARWLLKSSSRGRVLWARFVYRLPVVGTLLRSARLAAFADLLGILVDQGVPLPEALRLAAQASSDPLLTEGAKQIEANVRQGMPLGAALQRKRLVPDLVVWMIGFGEKQGTLGPALHQVAQLYRRAVELRAALIRTILPPLLIVLVAGPLAGLFILGLMAPLLSLLDGLSGGGK
jgi:general secretion pathway protein F